MPGLKPKHKPAAPATTPTPGGPISLAGPQADPQNGSQTPRPSHPPNGQRVQPRPAFPTVTSQTGLPSEGDRSGSGLGILLLFLKS